MKSNKGITLIALIITIIVLIILAGISIAVLTGEDGLITKAKQGALNYQNAAIEEQQALNSIYTQAGAQMAVGSTNNGSTQSNQGGVLSQQNGATTGGLTQEEHNWLAENHRWLNEMRNNSSGGGSGTGNGGDNNVYYLGTGTSFDLKLLQQVVDYTQLTADNFIVGASSKPSASGSWDGKGTWTASNGATTITKSYDPDTGILTIGGYSYSSSLSCSGWGALWSQSSNLTCFAYLVTGEIIRNVIY